MRNREGTDTIRLSVVDTSRQFLAHQSEIHDVIDAVLSGDIEPAGNSYIEQFEKAFAAYCGRSWAVGLASGTTALYLALEALGIGPGDEVVTSTFTFQATAAAIAHLHARPVFADVSPDSLLIDPESVASALTPHTRVILPVHLYGSVAPMSALMKLAAAHNLSVVEDCAQSFGALGEDGPAGSFGRIACYSFGPTKNFNAFGEAGGLLCDDLNLTMAIRDLAFNGSRGDFLHNTVGSNGRLDVLQAALLLHRLQSIDLVHHERRRVALRYMENLRHLAEVSVIQHPVDPGPVYSKFTLRVTKREALRMFLAQHGVEVCIYYPLPLHLQPCFRDLGYTSGSLPVAEEASHNVLSLPIYPELLDCEVDDICTLIVDFYRN